MVHGKKRRWIRLADSVMDDVGSQQPARGGLARQDHGNPSVQHATSLRSAGGKIRAA